MKVTKITLLLIAGFLIITTPLLHGQKKFAPIGIVAPSLTIAPDARGGGMGDNGVSTTPDMASQYWNPAKYAFQYSKAGLALSYTPWLRKLVNDIALVYLSGFYKIGDSDLQAIGASIRYFSLGELTDRTLGSDIPISMSPYEMAADISYSLKLSESYSMAVALRYIHSDLGARSDDNIQPDGAFAADVAGYLERYVVLGSSECLWTLGFNVSNIGTRMSYDGGENNQFLPTTLKLGTGLLYPLDDYNRLGFYVDVSKYLVPSYPLQNGISQEAVEDFENRRIEYNDMSPITGIFKSFTDSPRGFTGELEEIRVSLGGEYSYNDQFFVRGGYYYENPYMGNRQYFSVGAGFRMSVFQLDAAYLISTVQSNPLDQTLRFSLSFDMDGLKNLFR